MTSATLLLPASSDDIHTALKSLKIWPLLTGFRGRPAGDLDALVAAIAAIAEYGEANASQLLELDVNPLLVLPQGLGVVAVDALIHLGELH